MFSNDDLEDVEIIAAICLTILIISTATFIFGGEFINGTLEPVWWIRLENWIVVVCATN